MRDIPPQAWQKLETERNIWLASVRPDGAQPVICEGQAEPVSAPWPADVVELFRQKYDWDISTEEQYAGLIEVTPEKWLAW